MRRLRCGVASACQGPLLVCLGLLALTISLTGCATSSAEPTPAAEPMAQAERADTEDDGLPAQTAPRAGIRQLPDDPSEPFSRNYGLQLARRPDLPARLSMLEEDALIASAIAAHEMRRP